jgi:glycerophosphoryl diester phosphodiesterase
MEIYAHRGASAYAPENTMAAYKMAFDELNADGIEMDVHYSKDKELVVIHDFELSRTTNGTGFVFLKTLKELRQLSAGVKFSKEYENEKIPTLREVLSLISEKNKKINIELKAGSFFYPDI